MWHPSMLTNTSMMQSQKNHDHKRIVSNNKQGINKQQETEGNNSKTKKGKRVLDVKFSKKAALHMAELMLQS